MTNIINKFHYYIRNTFLVFAALGGSDVLAEAPTYWRSISENIATYNNDLRLEKAHADTNSIIPTVSKSFPGLGGFVSNSLTILPDGSPLILNVPVLASNRKITAISCNNADCTSHAVVTHSTVEFSDAIIENQSKKSSHFFVAYRLQNSIPVPYIGHLTNRGKNLSFLNLLPTPSVQTYSDFNVYPIQVAVTPAGLPRPIMSGSFKKNGVSLKGLVVYLCQDVQCQNPIFKIIESNTNDPIVSNIVSDPTASTFFARIEEPDMSRMLVQFTFKNNNSLSKKVIYRTTSTDGTTGNSSFTSMNAKVFSDGSLYLGTDTIPPNRYAVLKCRTISCGTGEYLMTTFALTSNYYQGRVSTMLEGEANLPYLLIWNTTQRKFYDVSCMDPKCFLYQTATTPYDPNPNAQYLSNNMIGAQ